MGCSPLSEATTARIQALPLEQLEALAEARALAGLQFVRPDQLRKFKATTVPTR